MMQAQHSKQQQVLEDYFDELLLESTDQLLQQATEEPVIVVKEPVFEAKSADADSTFHSSAVEAPKIEVKETAVDMTDHVIDKPFPTSDIIEPRSQEQFEELENSAQIEKRFPKAPDWAQSRFECLLFDVSGLRMAVPMIQLGGITRVGDEEFSQLFGQPSWHLGLYKDDNLTLTVVDTANLIMPEQNLDLKDQQITHLLRLDKSEWGLACLGVSESIGLEPDEVRWRSGRTSRPWLAGTVIDKMCALIDVDELIRMLDTGRRSSKYQLKQ